LLINWATPAPFRRKSSISVSTASASGVGRESSIVGVKLSIGKEPDSVLVNRDWNHTCRAVEPPRGPSLATKADNGERSKNNPRPAVADSGTKDTEKVAAAMRTMRMTG